MNKDPSKAGNAYYLGRAQEGLKSPAAVDSYKTSLAMKETGDTEPLVVDARPRVAVNPLP